MEVLDHRVVERRLEDVQTGVVEVRLALILALAGAGAGADGATITTLSTPMGARDGSGCSAVSRRPTANPARLPAPGSAWAERGGSRLDTTTSSVPTASDVAIPFLSSRAGGISPYMNTPPPLVATIATTQTDRSSPTRCSSRSSPSPRSPRR